jgi:3-oxoadipate enol-lactonase
VPKVALPGTELNYERAGEGEPLLLIQGMTANRLAWGRPFSSLLEESFELISFDNRGMGLSSPASEGFSIAEMAADTAALLEALEIESAHVLGISMGGMIAQELALAHPGRLRSLTIGCSYCGGPGSQLMDPADFQGMAEAMSSGDAQRIYRAMWEVNLSPGFREDESRYPGFTEMSEALPASRQTIGFQMQAILAHDTSARLPDLTIPTLVIHGTADRVLGYPNGPLIASLVPGARLETLEDVGHMFWWEQPERSAELVRDHALAPA